MTNLQYLQSVLPLYICEDCGSRGEMNPDCPSCVQTELELAFDRMSELAHEADMERDEMRYVDGLDVEDYE